jgi:hypothetical protein
MDASLTESKTGRYGFSTEYPLKRLMQKKGITVDVLPCYIIRELLKLKIMDCDTGKRHIWYFKDITKSVIAKSAMTMGRG